MRSRKRDRLEIIYDILRIIREHNNSILPTPLLRYSNLSSQSFNEYLNELVEKGFIREVYDKKGRKYLSLTDKGFRYLEKYKKIIEFIDEFGL
jgi:predicted transcriptional regulator